MRKIVDIVGFDGPLKTKTDVELGRRAVKECAGKNKIKADGFLISTTTGRAYFYREETNGTGKTQA